MWFEHQHMAPVFHSGPNLVLEAIFTKTMDKENAPFISWMAWAFLIKTKKLRRAIPASKLSNHGEVRTTCVEPRRGSDPRLGDSHSTQKLWGCSWEDYNYCKPRLVPEKKPSLLVSCFQFLKSNSRNSFLGTWTNMTRLSLPKENIIETTLICWHVWTLFKRGAAKRNNNKKFGM